MYNLDANHTAIVEAFKQCGCCVAEIAKSKSDVAGIPDLIVGIPDHRRGVYRIGLVEVKTDTGKLAPAQAAFMAEWADYPVYVVRNIDDVIKIINGGVND